MRTELRGSQGYRPLQSDVWERPWKQLKLILRHSLDGWRARFEYELSGNEGSQVLAGAEWADWDSDRGLVYAADGRLYRVRPSETGLDQPAEIANFAADRPKPRTPPDWATRWQA